MGISELDTLYMFDWERFVLGRYFQRIIYEYLKEEVRGNLKWFERGDEREIGEVKGEIRVKGEVF